MGTWERLGARTAPLDRRKLGVRLWAPERMRKGLRTSRDRRSLGHLDWFWRDYPWLLHLELRCWFLLKGVVGALPMFRALFSLESFCWGMREV